MFGLWVNQFRGLVNAHHLTEKTRINCIHDDPDIFTWAAIAQGAVNAIRLAGATQQTILLSGTNYTYAGSFLDSNSAYALNFVQDPTGDGSKLIFDVHQYLDSSTGNDPTHLSPVCVTDGIDNSLDQLALWLRCMGRQALLTEVGGWDVSTCVTYTCRMTKFIKENSDGRSKTTLTIWLFRLMFS